MRRERFPLVLGASSAALGAIVVALAAALGGSNELAGAASGSALAVANGMLLSFLGLRLVLTRGPKWPYAMALGVKFLVLVALVFAIVVVWEVDAIWFAVGLSTGVVALLGMGVLASLVGLEQGSK